MWRGAIQFGLVTIPVKLYLATESGGIGFNMLHASCLNRIQMKIYCPYHDEVVRRSETVRGYEYAKGRYVVVTEEDVDSIPLKTLRAIEIEMFVDARNEAHGAQFVKQAYYLEPDEVRSLEELELPEADIAFKPGERAMAEQLVASMTGDFSADDYRDDYRQALMAVIERKVAGEQPQEPIQREAPTNIGDLMAALEASVAAARESRAAAAVTGADVAAAAPAEAAPRRRRKTA
jgi:DNA end-binding protein Ku